MTVNYGFIGLGNMAGAIIRGMCRSDGFAGDSIYGFNRSVGKTEALARECGLIPAESAADLVEKCEVVVLAVKPQMLDGVLGGISEKLGSGKLVITIAAGKTLDWYAARLPEGTPVIRVMPNIAAKVGCSVSAICGSAYVDDAQFRLAEAIFSSVGKVYRLDEGMFPAFGAIGGASGAFVYMYIDALTDAGVRAGFPRPMALELAAQTVLGAARLQEVSGEHPIVLMNQVCSPGGTTIEGVLKLRELGFESCVHQGINAIIEKDKRL